MKKLILLLVLILIPAFVGAVSMPDMPEETLCNAVTATGNCTRTLDVRSHAQDAFPNLACTLTAGGTAATTFVVGILGANDSSVFGANTPLVQAHTYTVATTDTAQFVILNKVGWRYWKANYTSKSGGDGTSSITVKCKGWR